MKIFILNQIIFLLLIVTFISCKKDSITNPERTKIYYLSKIYENTSLVTEYIYDDNDNVIRKNIYSEDGSLLRYYEYTYNTEGQLGRIDNYSLANDSTFIHSWTNFVYDTNNNIIRAQNYLDFYLHAYYVNYVYYQYNNSICNQVIYIDADYFGYPVDTTSIIEYSYDNSNHLTEIIEYYYPSYRIDDIYQFEYDNKNYYGLHLSFNDEFQNKWYKQKNNITKRIRYNRDMTESWTTEYQYVYNQDNFPVSRTKISYSNDQTSEQTDMHYEYIIK